MKVIKINGVTVHVRETGDLNGPPVLFANSMGTELRLWDALIPLLPKGLRLIHFNKCGHGLSEYPDAPYSMGDLTTDTECLIRGARLRACYLCGSIHRCYNWTMLGITPARSSTCIGTLEHCHENG